MTIPIGPLTSSPVIRRHPANPVLTAQDVPYDALLVFNAGVTKYQGKYVMVFRNDYGRRPDSVHPRATNLGLAFSDDGVKWDVQPKPCWQWRDEEVTRVYDPRLTVMDGRCYMCFAVDTLHGVCGGIAATDDFERFEVLSVSVPDNRNMVLFPSELAASTCGWSVPSRSTVAAAGKPYVYLMRILGLLLLIFAVLLLIEGVQMLGWVRV